jgi:TonB family protein
MVPNVSNLCRIALGVTITLFFSVQLFAQNSSPKHFSKDGLAFDYPAEWTLSDQSNDQAQHLILAGPGSSPVIIVWAYREAVHSRFQVVNATRQITEPYIRTLSEKLSSGKSVAKRESTCVTVGEATVGGTMLRGVVDDAPTVAEIYAFPKGGRFVNLLYLRTESEGARGTSAWKLVRDSLRVDPLEPNQPGDSEVDLASGALYAGGVLNGKALKLPAPPYPAEARGAHASGTVPVMVTIDETGKVIEARAISGHPLLIKASEESARRASFAPTMLCGKPVKVTGTIIYNFVAR